MHRSPTRSGEGIHSAVEGHSKLAADLAAQLKVVKKLEQRLEAEQGAHRETRLRMQDLMHERAGLGA